MPFFISGLDKKLQKVAGRIGHAACALPDEQRDTVIDGLLVALTTAHADPESTPYERDELRLARERLLSALADSPLKVQLDHGEELKAVAEKDRVRRAKRQEEFYLKRHKQAHMAQAERNYVPPSKT